MDDSTVTLDTVDAVDAVEPIRTGDVAYASLQVPDGVRAATSYASALGWTYIEPMLFGDYFGGAIVVRPEHAVLWEMKNEWRGVAAFVQHGVLSLPFWLALAGIAAAWYCYLVNPALPARIKSALGPVHTLLDNCIL